MRLFTLCSYLLTKESYDWWIHRPLNSEMDMAILDSDGGGGSDVASITSGVPGVAGGAEGATSGIGPVEGTVGAGALVSTGISTGCNSFGCSGCGISGCSGPGGAPGSTS